MDRLKSEFLESLKESLGNHKEKETIIAEYEMHLDELLLSLYKMEYDEMWEEVYSRFGTPEEIAAIWKEEFSFTSSNMKWLFIAVNILFFIGGAALTLAHNLLDWKWLTNLWSNLTSFPIIIAFIYMFFWALLGYEIGRGFGHKGKRVMKKTFILALIPNVTLMVLTVFHLIPREWFYPLLNETFIGVCIFLTLLLYPVCFISYRWGKKASI